MREIAPVKEKEREAACYSIHVTYLLYLMREMAPIKEKEEKESVNVRPLTYLIDAQREILVRLHERGRELCHRLGITKRI